jgi:hypothetical protein
MGQPVAVIEKPSSTRGVTRFELNRNLTGMGHLHYDQATPVSGSQPADVLARRLFDTGKATEVHVYGNIVTVSLAPGQTSDGLRPVIEGLYTYYVPGFVPPPIEMPAEAATPAAASDATAAPAAGVDSRVPAALLERSRLARARWAAKAAG